MSEAPNFLTDPLWNRVAEAEREVVRPYLSARPVRVGELANALGLDVVRAPLAPRISGLIHPFEEAQSGYQIKVNKYEVPERQRFTIAHEIAHYLLHRNDIGAGVVDSIMYRSNLTSRKETEANRLAAAIVMPYRAVVSELERLGGLSAPGTVEDLAATFKVSLPAMKVRLGIA
jgi:predicted transcriptional regulator